MIVVDASVLIAHLESTDAHHDRAGRLLIEAADELLGASPLTLVDVLVGPARIGALERAQSALDDLGVEPIPLTAGAPARLAALRVSTGLRLPDCCVLLAAETTEAAVGTFDDRLAAAAASLGRPVHQ